MANASAAIQQVEFAGAAVVGRRLGGVLGAVAELEDGDHTDGHRLGPHLAQAPEHPLRAVRQRSMQMLVSSR